MMLKSIAFILCLLIINSVVEARDIKNRLCNGDKMIPGTQFDALGEALAAVLANPPGATRTAKVGPYRAWARSDCYESGDCYDCVNELVEKVYGICENAVGVQVVFGECALRYEFFAF